MRRVALATTIAFAALAVAFPVAASAGLEWSIIEQSMSHLCGSELEDEQAKAAARRQRSCVNVAEAACEAKPVGPEQAILHSEGCEIVQENASRRTAPASQTRGGSGDTGLIAGLIAAALVTASSLWVAFDSNSRDWSGAKGPQTRTGQAVGVLLLWPVFFPLYVIQRRRRPARNTAN
jgi:hypothetical protein